VKNNISESTNTETEEIRVGAMLDNEIELVMPYKGFEVIVRLFSEGGTDVHILDRSGFNITSQFSDTDTITATSDNMRLVFAYIDHLLGN